MFQKGPGEGYNAAKVAVLAINPKLWCKGIYYNGKIVGYTILPKGVMPHTPQAKTGVIGNPALTSRDAWINALVVLKEAKAN